jgi:hypothetical protein
MKAFDGDHHSIGFTLQNGGVGNLARPRRRADQGGRLMII